MLTLILSAEAGGLPAWMARSPTMRKEPVAEEVHREDKGQDSKSYVVRVGQRDQMGRGELLAEERKGSCEDGRVAQAPRPVEGERAFFSDQRCVPSAARNESSRCPAEFLGSLPASHDFSGTRLLRGRDSLLKSRIHPAEGLLHFLRRGMEHGENGASVGQAVFETAPYHNSPSFLQ